MLKQIRKLLDLYELLNEKMGGLYAIKEMAGKAVLYATFLKKSGDELAQKDFEMTDGEYKFYMACRSAFLCLPDDVREKMGRIIAK